MILYTMYPEQMYLKKILIYDVKTKIINLNITTAAVKSMKNVSI